jgi:hypothetical protein
MAYGIIGGKMSENEQEIIDAVEAAPFRAKQEMKRKIKRTYRRTAKGDTTPRWLQRHPGGIRVPDDCKKRSNEGVYVFIENYCWEHKDGHKDEGQLLTLAPYFEVDGEIFWRARQGAGRNKGGKDALRNRYDKVSISIPCGPKLAKAISALCGAEGMSEERADTIIADKEAARQDELMSRYL